MDENRFSGTANEALGRAEKTVGGVLGDTKTEATGAIRQAKGQAQDAFGQLADTVREQPISAVLIGVMVGYLIARLRIV